MWHDQTYCNFVQRFHKTLVALKWLLQRRDHLQTLQSVSDGVKLATSQPSTCRQKQLGIVAQTVTKLPMVINQINCKHAYNHIGMNQVHHRWAALIDAGALKQVTWWQSVCKPSPGCQSNPPTRRPTIMWHHQRGCGLVRSDFNKYFLERAGFC